MMLSVECMRVTPPNGGGGPRGAYSPLPQFRIIFSPWILSLVLLHGAGPGGIGISSGMPI
jgi:hypothetical protein